MNLIIATLWARRVGDEYDEAPELLEAWTEWQIDNWREGWDHWGDEAEESIEMPVAA